MPLIKESSYRAPTWLPGAHLQTIFPALFRRAPHPEYQRKRLELIDGDFLDVDWYDCQPDRIAILSHGLEGNSQAGYMRGMANTLLKNGWGVVSWNNRGCSGEMNRLKTFYHAGKTDDLSAVIDEVATRYPESDIDLVGFSLGGNILLNYLGRNPETVNPAVRSAVAISVPCNLADSARQLSRPANRIYTYRFIQGLTEKVKAKNQVFPELNVTELCKIHTLEDFDEKYTAMLHGFENALDYWARSSSGEVLGEIKFPTLLINALNDPFIGGDCFPYNMAKESKSFFLETPETGGHVGFAGKNGKYWSETRTVDFLKNAPRSRCLDASRDT